jgi:hypothetical protein
MPLGLARFRRKLPYGRRSFANYSSAKILRAKERSAVRNDETENVASVPKSKESVDVYVSATFRRPRFSQIEHPRFHAPNALAHCSRS